MLAEEILHAYPEAIFQHIRIMDDDDIGGTLAACAMRWEFRRAFRTLRWRWRAIREGRGNFTTQPRGDDAGLPIRAEFRQQLRRVRVFPDLRRIRFHAARA